jgi:hypothetical protein
MKDDLIAFLLVLIMIFFFIIYPFAIWGGCPEGLWWKVERYQKKNEKRIENLELLQEQVEKINSQIEILRTQLGQIKPNVKKRHNRRVSAVLRAE